jgi:ubiquinone/menaquinone biosynthesis C-methylase UbiE
MAAADENKIAIEAWNTVLFDKFVRFRDVVTTGLAGHGDVALERASFPKGSRIVDVGCGFGDTTLQIAKSLGPEGSCVGIDCAERFIAVGRDDAAKAGIPNASFLVRDVQNEDLGGPYDHGFARFGTMFFDSPVAALRRVRAAIKPGGTFTMVVWRKREDNPWLHEAELCVRGIVPVVEHDQTDQVHCGPGPFSMAGPDMVSEMMQKAGFRRVTFERHDCEIFVGKSIDAAVEVAMELGPAGEIIRLAGEEGERLRPKVTAALREVFAKYARKDGVWGGSSSWFVSGVVP